MIWEENGIERLHPLSSSGKVNLNETCHLPGGPLVTAGQHQSSLISMGLALGDHIEAGEITGEKSVTHPDVTLCDSVTNPGIGCGKGKSIPQPEASDSLLYEPLVEYLRWMVFASMHNGNARASRHETGDDFIPCRFDPCGVKDLHHKREDEGDGFGLGNDRIPKGWVMHLHHLTSSFVE
jgi:hypothetical protein